MTKKFIFYIEEIIISSKYDFNKEFKINIVEPCLSLLQKNMYLHSELNFDKIKDILLLILKEMDEREIQKSEDVIVLTAAVIWHNTFNRSGDKDYLLQEKIEELIGGSLNAVRHLRKELNIESRTYDSMDTFIEDLSSYEDLELENIINSDKIPYWDEIKDYIQKEIIGRKKTNQSILEASVFLYFNKNRNFSRNELWSVSKSQIDYLGDTPSATFNTELSRYSNNSDASEKRTPLLFTITNLGEAPYKHQLIREIRFKIDDFIKSKSYNGYERFLSNSMEDQIKYEIQKSNLDEFLIIESKKGQTHQLINKLVKKEITGPNFIFNGRGSKALMKYDSNKYYLMKDSIMLNDYKDYFVESFSGLLQLRTELIEKGIFKKSDVDYILQTNLQFNSPSPIACLCAGGSYNGFIAFKMINNPEMTLKQYLKNYEIREKDNQKSVSKVDIAVKGEEVSDYNNFSKRKILATTLINSQTLEKLKYLLIKYKQIILYGPPGTSKTYLALVLAQKISNMNYEIIQFHPSYSYEDFVESIVAIPSSDNNIIQFQPKPKIFRKLCSECLKNLNENYVLIIDEINRGDLGRIFGELILGLEPSNRNLAIETPLSYELGKLTIPPNLYIIGTMNSLDRSIAIVDYALRRRFIFYPLIPDSEILKNWLNSENNNISQENQTKILNFFQNLNNKIKEDKKLGKNYQIGHTYFFIKNEEELNERWEYMIKPLLEEYLNFNEENLEEYKFENFI